MHFCEVKPLQEPSSNGEVTPVSTSLVRPKLAQTLHRKEVSSMLRLKINLAGAAVCLREVPAQKSPETAVGAPTVSGYL